MTNNLLSRLLCKMPGTEDDPNSREVPWHHCNILSLSLLSLLLLGALAPGQPVLASRADEGKVKNLGKSNLTPPINYRRRHCGLLWTMSP